MQVIMRVLGALIRISLMLRLHPRRGRRHTAMKNVDATHSKTHSRIKTRLDEDQTMVMDDGTPKGMKMVLEERGINTSRMNADNMSCAGQS